MSSVTALLVGWSEGDSLCLNQLLPLVEHELRVIARRHMRRERPGHILQPTALVNEAIKLIDGNVEGNQVTWRNRAHFFGFAARILRQILVDHARTSRRE